MERSASLSKPTRGDFIKPKNVVDSSMRDSIYKLKRQGDVTRERSEHEHRDESWFQEWDTMPTLPTEMMPPSGCSPLFPKTERHRTLL